jgi:hypothetical protein
MIDEFHVLYMYKKIQAEAAGNRYENTGTAFEIVPQSCRSVGKNTIRRLVRRRLKS